MVDSVCCFAMINVNRDRVVHVNYCMFGGDCFCCPVSTVVTMADDEAEFDDENMCSPGM